MLVTHKKEIARWLNDPTEPELWVRAKYDETKSWYKISFYTSTWSEDYHYIVDDKLAELRKLQLDDSSIKFEYYNYELDGWIETTDPLWNLDTMYRINLDTRYPIFKVCNKDTNKAVVVKFTGLNSGEVVFAMPKSDYKVGFTFKCGLKHTDECWEDVEYNLERGLFDKQPVLCWNVVKGKVKSAKTINLYDAKNDCVFTLNGKRNGRKYTKYMKYPHPNDEFIVEMFRTLKD